MAKRAGVSITTVSRVINNNYPVNAKTREKVEAAIKEMEFSPNLLARGLIQKKTLSIGVVVPSITNLFFSVVVNGIQDCCGVRGYNILLSDSGGNAGTEEKQVKALAERRVDGIISIDPRTKNITDGFYENFSNKIPLVLVNGYSDGIGCNFVSNDQESGTIEALEYLIQLGHRSIAFMRGHQSYSYDLKEKIYKEILSKHGITEAGNNILEIENGNSTQTVDLALKKFLGRLAESERPTAVFACNDWMATGALHAAQKIGLKVPEDISVIGYDNIIVSEISLPRLTTVDQNMNLLGIRSAERLFEIIDGDSAVRKITLSTNLIKRESCSTAAYQ